VRSAAYTDLIHLEEAIWNYLKSNLKTKKVNFVENTKQIVFKDTLIGFFVQQSLVNGFLLSFFCHGVGCNMEVVRDLCELLNDDIRVTTEIGSVDFQKIVLKSKWLSV
jgi:hypothetical protein